MSYPNIWRIFVALFAFLLLLIPIFQYWGQHPVLLLGSLSLSKFLISYWWAIVVGLLAITLLVLAILPIFDKGVPMWVRVFCALLSLVMPIFLPYWLARVELPLWRARRLRGA